jgi:hypothetical protein
MSATSIQGKDLMLFTGTTTKKPMALATSCKLTINHSVKSKSTKDSGDWEESTKGKLKWTASTDGLVTMDATTQSYEYLYDAMIARDPITLTFGIATGTSPSWTVDATKDIYVGTAFIDSLDLNSGSEDDATYTASFTGTSGLTKTNGV